MDSIELCLRDANGLIVGWQVGWSEEDIERMLTEHPGWTRSVEYFGEGKNK